jgi:hypothetical protein
MNEEQEQIWQYLQDNAVGQDNRKTTSEIRDACFLESGGPTNEHVRDLCREMIHNYGCCIGSDSSGYWIIDSSEELDEVVESLRERADAINERADALIENWNNKLNQH